MALSAGEAQCNYATEYEVQVRFNAKTPKVKVLPELKINDFVLIDWSGEWKLAKILKFIDGKVHIRWFLRKSELPRDCELIDKNGVPIELDDDHEVVEDSLRSENVENKLILCKCQVYLARVNDSIAAVYELHRKNHTKMYVCRFKLVKKTVYKLQPVSWHREESNSDDESVVDDTCTEDESDALGLTRILGQIKLSERKRKITKVTPIKIVNGALVQKLKRSTKNGNDDDIDDVEISPSKRGKYVNEQNGNYLTESPKSGDQTRSYGSKVGKAKKNLNSSFLDASDQNDSLDEAESYTVDRVESDKNQMKITLRKNSPTPLKELHDNAIDTPNRNLRKQVLNKTIQPDVAENVTPSASHRKSILKAGDDSVKMKSTGRGRGRVIINDVESKSATVSPDRIVETPKKMEMRRTTRMSSANAKAKIQLEAEDHTPEQEKGPSKTKKTAQTPRTPKTKPTQDECKTPRTTGRRTSTVPKTPTSVLTPQRSRQLFRAGNLTPSIQSRETALSSEQNGLETIRERLHVSAVPDSLPCRESEFQSIHSFVKDKINDACGGCIYISGVPGTGKTATVTQVVHKLQADVKRHVLPKFDYVEINGMRLTEPRQAYVQIYRQLTGKTLAWAQARDLLEKRFTDPKAITKKQTRSTILLIDELDIICNRKQDVVYNLFDWTSKRDSRLVAITIANTMDLPERVLKLKVASRLGLTRITFQPYSFKQLQEVVMARLAGSNHFVSDAVQLVARKVASVSGDCRRALDICRRATEIAEEMNAKNQIVGFAHVNKALEEMFASPRIKAIKCCTKFEKLFLQAVASEITRTGIEEVDFRGVYAQMQILAPVLGIKNPPNQSAALEISAALGASRLLIVEDSRADIYQKIILNVSVDDLHYALNRSDN